MARTAPRLVAMATAALLLVPALAAPAAAKPGDGILLLQSYSTKPGEVLLGGEFELRLKVSNEGSKKAEDLLVTLGSGTTTGGEPGAAAAGGGAAASTLVVVGGGNTKHLDRLDGDEEAVVTFRLQSDPSGTPGLVALPVTLEYSSGGRHSLSQTVGIVLRRPTRLRVISFDAPEKVQTGEQFEVAAEVTNAGDAKVSAVGMRLEGAAARIEGDEVFLGNLEPGDGDVLEAAVTLEKPGEAELTLIVSYLDEFGETRETTQSVKVTSSGPEETVDPEPVAEETEGGFFAGIGRFFRALFGLGD